MSTLLVKNYTADRVASCKPKIYRQVANYLAEGFSHNKITKLCSVHWMTVKAIAKRESHTVEERKKQLVSLLGNVAQLSGERVEAKVGNASVRDATIAMGVSVQRMLELLGQGAGVQVAIVNMPTAEQAEERAQSHAKLDEITRLLKDRQPRLLPDSKP